MNVWYLTSEIYHHFHPQSKMCHVCRGFFLQAAFALPAFWANWEQGNDHRKMLCWSWSSNVLLAASEVVGVPTAWGIEWASSGLSCSHTGFPVLHCEFSVDFKNLQVCTVAYKFGLPLLFLGDMNKFLSKGNVLSGELFLYYVFRFGFVSTQLAQSTGRMSSILYVTVHFYVRQNLV